MKATEGSAGYDLMSTMDAEILPRTRMLIPTGVRLNLKKSTFGLIKSRSGLACKGIDVKAGVIDSDYSGEVKVLLANESETVFSVKKNMRIAQLLILPIKTVQPTTEIIEHGHKGFGSTGQF